MKVKYIGNYREEASVKFKGVSFTKGEATDVTEEWYSVHKCPKLEAKAGLVAGSIAPKEPDQNEGGGLMQKLKSAAAGGKF